MVGKANKYLVMICLAAFPVLLWAQKKKWTLQECIDYAVRHNLEVKQGQNEIERLKVERFGLKSRFLPDLEGGISQQFDFGRSLNRSNTYEDSNTRTSSFSLSSELPLFVGFQRIASVSRNKYDLRAAEAKRKWLENRLALNITGCYFQVLLDKEMLGIAKKQIELTREQVKKTLVLLENGKAPQSQLREVHAQLADDELAATEANNALRMSMVELMQLMELQGMELIDVDSLENVLLPVDEILPEEIYISALRCMPQVQAAMYSLESSKKAVKIAQSGYYPTLSLGAGINSSYYHSVGAVNRAFASQMRNNMQKSVYLTLSFPLFDRLVTRTSVRTARIEVQNAMLALENEKKQLYKEIETAYTDALSAWEKYCATQRAVAANEESHRYALEKYSAGKSTVYEYNEAKMKLADALSKQSQAKYTYLLKERILAFYSCRPMDS